MMRVVAYACLLATSGLSLPVLASEPKQEEARSEEKPKATKKICKRIATGMGSRVKERVCLTREQWRELNNQR